MVTQLVCNVPSGVVAGNDSVVDDNVSNNVVTNNMLLMESIPRDHLRPFIASQHFADITAGMFRNTLPPKTKSHHYYTIHIINMHSTRATNKLLNTRRLN